MPRTLYMETTKIEAMKTIAQVQVYLINSGASGILVESDSETREPTSVKFEFPIRGKGIMGFVLPARIEPIFQHIQDKRPDGYQEKYEERDREQAARVAWRQILRWVQAQFALIESGMVEIAEVFLPYAMGANGQTLFEAIEQKGYKGLLAEREE